MLARGIERAPANNLTLDGAAFTAPLSARQLADLDFDALRSLGSNFSGFAQAGEPSAMAPAFHNPPPRALMALRRPYLFKTYPRTFTRGPSPSRIVSLVSDRRTRRAALIARLLVREPAVRARFEKMAGGRMVEAMSADGTMIVQRQGRTGSSTPPFTSLFDLLGRMEAQVLEEASDVYTQQRSGFSAAGVGVGAHGIEKDGPISDVALGVFMIDLEKLEHMYSLIKTMYSKFEENARSTIERIGR